jgi:hypothetical protein
MTALTMILWLVCSLETAHAQERARPDDEHEHALRPPSDDDRDVDGMTPDPTPRVPEVLEGDDSDLYVVEQAGVGGPIAYASATVLEVGGSGSIIGTEQFVSVRFAPFVGWFLADGIQLVYSNEIVGGTHQDRPAFAFIAAVELAVHLKITDRLLVFGGPGVGVLYNGNEAGLLLRPRVGLDILVGRSAILRPAFSFGWSTVDMFDLAGDDLPSIRIQYGFEIGYSAMF